MNRVHVIGAGLAGLAAALRLSKTGFDVSLYESSGHAGGRCRSYRDDLLDIEIDNGNHLMLSGNRAAMAFIDEVGARNTVFEAPEAAFPFVDFDNGRSWTIRPNEGLIPWWVASPSRRVPDTSIGDYIAGLRFRRAPSAATVADCLKADRPAFRRFWEPLTVAVLNTRAEEAAANLLWPVLVETFGRGAAACRPCIAKQGLSRSFAGPALAELARRRAVIRFNARLRAIEAEGGRVSRLRFGAESIEVDPNDGVILAVPPVTAVSLLPGLTVPDDFRPIANGHFVVESMNGVADNLPFLGIIGGTAEWLFVRNDVVSVTVSAADHVIDQDAESLAARLWQDVSRALGLPSAPIPRHRIVKEKRATFAQTPAQVRRRPGPRGRIANLMLAGDWTDTGLPATIEGAIRSGNTAAEALRTEIAR